MGTVSDGQVSGAQWLARTCALLLVASATVFAANFGFSTYLDLKLCMSWR